MSLERIIPDNAEAILLYAKHIARYMFSRNYIRDKEILDAGCGCGYGSKFLADNNAKKVIGIDISDEAIDYAKAHYSNDNLQYLLRDCTKTNLPNNAFDIIIAYEIIEHLREPEIFLNEMSRLLRDDGILIVSTPNKATFSPNTDIFSSPNEFHVREYYYEQFVELLKSCFDKIEMFAEHNSPSYLRNSENIKTINENIKILDKKISDLDRKISDVKKEIIDTIFPRAIRKLLPKFIRNHFNKKILIKEADMRNRLFNEKIRLEKTGVIEGLKPPIMNWTDIDINQYNFDTCLYFIAVCRKK